MEELTKHQIVLLMLLISFVTSIATGIVTVSLMDEENTGVTHTVNRVVERTIERVVANTEPTEQVAQVVTKEVRTVLSEGEYFAELVAELKESMVEVFSSTSSPALGRAVVVESGRVFAPFALDVKESLFVVNENGVQANVTSATGTKDLFILTLDTPEVFTARAPIGRSSVSPGTQVLSLGGTSGDALARGSVTYMSKIETNASTTENINALQYVQSTAGYLSSFDGAPLYTEDGTLIGFYTGEKEEYGFQYMFLPSALQRGN